MFSGGNMASAHWGLGEIDGLLVPPGKASNLISRLSRDCNLFSLKFVRQSRDIRASVARHSYECRLVLFSRQIVARFSQDCRATVVRHPRDIRTSVAKISHCKFAKISRRQVRDTRTNVARPSHDSRATVLRNILEKKFA